MDLYKMFIVAAMPGQSEDGSYSESVFLQIDGRCREDSAGPAWCCFIVTIRDEAEDFQV